MTRTHTLAEIDRNLRVIGDANANIKSLKMDLKKLDELKDTVLESFTSAELFWMAMDTFLDGELDGDHANAYGLVRSLRNHFENLLTRELEDRDLIPPTI